MTLVRDDLHRSLVLTPDDWVLRMVYADCLEEEGELGLSNGQRWQALNKRRPDSCMAVPPYVWGWGWADSETYEKTWRSQHEWTLLPKPIFNNLTQTDIEGAISFAWVYYPTIEEAERDLAKALISSEANNDLEPRP